MARTLRKYAVNWISTLFVLVFYFAGHSHANKEGYYGKYIGKLSQLHHGVSGDVYAVDARTLHLRNFNYDGEGPAAYFYVGSSKTPGVNGFRLRDERGTTNVLPKYRNKHITVTLPEGKNLQNINWFSVWCDEFSVNFGDVKIPKNLDFPKPQKIGGLSGVHGVSSEPIVIVDAQTLLIPNFSYDGEAPDAKFWVGPGLKPTPQGIRIPDENGKEVPLRRYDRKTIVLTLPGDLTIFDIGHFGVWCEAFTVDFGHVQIPRGLNIPPSLKMLGVSPQSKLNCEVLWDDFAYEVRWAVAGDSIVLQLVARLENNEYMSFGLSGDKSRSRMVGGDVVVAWVDKESLKGYAEDYYLDAKSQCSGGRGSCPDENIAEGASSVRLLNAALVNGYSIVTFQRSLKAQDHFDKDVLTNQSQPVIWAIGPLNSRKEVSYHSLTNRGDIFIEFGRAPKWNCPTPESNSGQTETASDREGYTDIIQGAEVHNSKKQDTDRREVTAKTKTKNATPAPVAKSTAWEIPAIKCHEPEDGVFYAQMGPTGGKHGYSAITGHVGWGISWYINGLLIPEINVVRGRTYTFIVEGGLDPETPARYHPFYITDDPVGGYQYKTPEERLNIQIFAGAVQNKRGEVRPTGIGRLCNWTPDPNQPSADEFASFGAYQRTLRLECDAGNPGIIQWTVDKDTPDTVYYQCYTHRYLGWKINVHDECESEAANEPIPSVLKPPHDFEGSPEPSESINYEVSVNPNSQVLRSNRNNTLVDSSDGPLNIKHPSGFDNYKDKVGVDVEKAFIKSPPGPKTTHFHYKVNESRPASQDTLHKPSQSLLSEVGALQQQPNFHSSPSVLFSQDEKLLKLSTLNQVPGLSLYSVTEEPVEDKVQHSFQNFQILPATTFHDSLKEAFKTNVFQSQQNDGEVPKQEKPAFPISYAVQQAVNADKYGHNFFNNMQMLGIESGERKQNTKFKHHQKLGVRVPTSSVLSVPYKARKPVTGALTLQQRPLPTSAFRPPFLSKPPFNQAAKFHHPNQHRHHLKAEEDSQEVMRKRKPIAVAAGAKVRAPTRVNYVNNEFAHNTGFNPDSIKVEGGFKPILGTGQISNSSAIDRADTDIGHDNVETDDVFSHPTGTSHELTSAQKWTEDEIKGRTKVQNETFHSLFQPIFIPSTPDHNFGKLEEKGNQKTGQNIILKEKRHFGSGDEGQTRRNVVVSRPRVDFPNVRQTYRPQNLGPPLKVPFRGPSFQLRHLLNWELSQKMARSLSEFERGGNDVGDTTGSQGTDGRGKGIDNNDEVYSGKDEIALADEKKEFFIPAKSDKFLAYDGKVVRVEPAPTIADSGLSADISRLPQFVPYKGSIPPLSDSVNAGNLPQLKSSKLARHDILPLAEVHDAGLAKEPGPGTVDGPLRKVRPRRKRAAHHTELHTDHGHHQHEITSSSSAFPSKVKSTFHTIFLPFLLSKFYCGLGR